MIEEKQLLDSALSHTRRVLDFSPYKSYSGITSREEFQDSLSKDPAFSALGLDDERYVIARVGGNLITSLHRKIGDLYEDVFRSTDGLVKKEKYNSYIPPRWQPFDGVGFEIRSCYQIGDSKRIQADYDRALALKNLTSGP